jgi:hypothetical protein
MARQNQDLRLGFLEDILKYLSGFRMEILRIDVVL